MKSRINDDFLQTYRRLPENVSDQARKASRLFKQNPQHPRLNFKSIHPSQPFYSARSVEVIAQCVSVWMIHHLVLDWLSCRV